MKLIKGKPKERFLQFLDEFSTRNADTRENLISFFDKNIHIIGTSKEEIANSPKEALKFASREIAQSPKGWTYEVKWLEETFINELTACVNAELSVVYYLENRIVSFDPVRFSAVFNNKNGKLLISNLHVSMTDGSSEEESFPGALDPKRYEEVSILFTDFVGFTHAASTIPARKLVKELNELFVEFDEISTRHGVDKIKTIGDAYMAVGGLKETSEEHALNCVNCAKEMISFLQERNKRTGIKWELRAGIHTGMAVGGIIGKSKLTFDLWGDTINIASKLEQNSLPNRINVSAYTFDLVKDIHSCEYRGKIDIKGKGSIDMYFVD